MRTLFWSLVIVAMVTGGVMKITNYGLGKTVAVLALVAGR